MSFFYSSREKIKRAIKHIQDLNGMLANNLPTDFYSVGISKSHSEIFTENDIVFSIDAFAIGRMQREYAVIIGDALHNLGSALDILYCDVVRANNKGPATKWTRFPVRETREELVAPLTSAIKQEQISECVRNFILDTIQPYKAGNYAIWALDDMNIMDKHQLLIPTFGMMAFSDVRLEDEKNGVVPYLTFFADESFRRRLDFNKYGNNPTVKNKGHAAFGIGFQLGTPYEGKPVLVTLNGIAEEVRRTLEAFEAVVRI